MERNKWLTEKPEFTEECTFVTATKYEVLDEDPYWDYSVWQIKKIDGYNDKDEPAWYYGLLNGDGEEWGDLDDLTVDLYYIIDEPKN